MTPDQFQIVTALTIGSIATIILLYLVVLKRKGWLTEETSPETSYLCPNPQCRKVFQSAVQLTDLSTQPTRTYLACPHCGLDLETISAVKVEKPRKSHETLTSRRPQLPAQLPPKDSANRMESPKSKMPDEIRVSEMPEAEKTRPNVDISKGLGKPAVSQDMKSPFQASSQPTKAPRNPEEKKFSERPRSCSHFFGYVKTLPKSTPIPDECMWCPMIVKCLTGTEKIEA